MTLRPAARMLALSEGASTPQHQGPLIFLMDNVPGFLRFIIKPYPNQFLEWFCFTILLTEYCKSLIDSYTKHIKRYQQNDLHRSTIAES